MIYEQAGLFKFDSIPAVCDCRLAETVYKAQGARMQKYVDKRHSCSSGDSQLSYTPSFRYSFSGTRQVQSLATLSVDCLRKSGAEP